MPVYVDITITDSTSDLPSDLTGKKNHCASGWCLNQIRCWSEEEFCGRPHLPSCWLQLHSLNAFCSTGDLEIVWKWRNKNVRVYSYFCYGYFIALTCCLSWDPVLVVYTWLGTVQSLKLTRCSLDNENLNSWQKQGSYYVHELLAEDRETGFRFTEAMWQELGEPRSLLFDF